MAHITGGGITDNLPRVLPQGMAARIDRASWEVPPLFQWLQRAGEVPEDDMLRTFNMGIGLILVCPPALVDPVLDDLRTRGEAAVVIGEILPGPSAVSYSSRNGVGSISQKLRGIPATRSRNCDPSTVVTARPARPIWK